MTLDSRLRALGEAAELADGRLDAVHVAAARAVVARAGARIGLGIENTVVALAGTTGAGKSSLFNALVGEEVVPAGRRRPTTSAATAAIWGSVDDALLDWLRVPSRRRRVGGAWDGLVLLDLPDFDSIEASNRAEAQRLVALVDLLVWVTDPQKYADASLHDDFLRPLASHGDTMLVVLNQVDTLDPAAAEACRTDLRRLLGEDGLPQVPVLAASAATGAGLDALRAAVAERVAARESAARRLAADVGDAAQALGAACGGRAPDKVGRRERDRLVAALEHAAGVPGVTVAVQRAHRRRGALATGWPFVRWIRRLRPDPLRRLRLEDRGGTGPAERTSIPPPAPLQLAQAEAASRALAEAVAGDLPTPWPGLVRRAATASEPELADRLERAVAGTDLGVRRPRWWSAASALQWGLAAAALIGLLWLLALAVLGYLRLDDVVPTPEIEDFPVPTVLLVGGAVLGLILAFVFRLLVRAGARRRAAVARRALRAQIAEAAGPLVIEPVEAELSAHRALCGQVATARG